MFIKKADGKASKTSVQSSGTKNTGLAIFSNKQHLSNLEALVGSQELDECYDYQSPVGMQFKKLYECLKEKDNR